MIFIWLWSCFHLKIHIFNLVVMVHSDVVVTRTANWNCCIATYIYKYKWKHYQIWYTNFNERTNTLLYKNISLTLYSQKGDVSCVWEMSWRKGQTAILIPSSSDHSSTSFSSWLGLLNCGSLRAQSPLSAASSHFGLFSPTDCFSKYPNSQAIASRHDVIHTPA